MIGGAQSAAEMLWASHQSFPNAQCTMVMRSIGLSNYESSKFTNELFYPSFVDKFHAASEPARQQLLREMHRTNYAGLAPAMLDSPLPADLPGAAHRGRAAGHARHDRGRRRAGQRDGEVVLTLLDRRTGQRQELRCDVVLLGTGFRPAMPRLIRDLAAAAGLDKITVDRAYRMDLPPR